MEKNCVNYLVKYNILYKHQHGFRSKHSTIHPILRITNEKITLDITLVVFLDSSKAFDTIDHDILLYKLCHCGIRGISNKWFSSYHSNHNQYIEKMIGNHH